MKFAALHQNDLQNKCSVAAENTFCNVVLAEPHTGNKTKWIRQVYELKLDFDPQIQLVCLKKGKSS